MYLTPFVMLFPELGWKETRTFRATGYADVPDGEYALIEAYCTDATCDCRRVMLNVAAKPDGERRGAPYLASVSYAFDRDDPDAGPFLDPLNPQCEYAEALLGIVEKVLQDPNYVARLEAHYRLVKESAGERPTRQRRGAKRGAPSPAGARASRRSRGTAAGASEGTQRRTPRRETGGGAARQPQERVPKAMRERFEEIVAITDEVCHQHLNEEYAQLSRQAAAALARKRPSPLARGQAKVWACGIVYALGSTNFLWDKTQTCHMSAGELCELFGVAKSTGANKARAIADSLGMVPFDWHWMLPSRIEDNPLVWMVSVDGLIVDVRDMGPEVQEEALRKGLIPYLPTPGRRER